MGQPKKNTKVTFQQEESLRLLKVGVMTWNLCRIDLSCPFCVAGVARSITTRFQIYIINKKAFSGGKSDQNHVDKRILGGKGLQYEESTSITFVRPVYLLYYIIFVLMCFFLRSAICNMAQF